MAIDNLKGGTKRGIGENTIDNLRGGTKLITSISANVLSLKNAKLSLNQTA